MEQPSERYADPQTTRTLAGLINRAETLASENAQLRAEIEELRGTATPPAGTSPYRKRPTVMRGKTVAASVGCGPLYVTLNEDENGRPFEVFFKLGKSGSCQQSYLEALGVAMSVGLRYGADPQKFIDKFEGMRCPNPRMRTATERETLSCADGVSQGLRKALDPVLFESLPVTNGPTLALLNSTDSGRTIDLIQDTTAMAIAPRFSLANGVGMCPKCSGALVSQGGCVSCVAECGWAGKCG